MQFYENQLFHIYNQGNNRKRVFFEEENYDFFLWKMRAYLLPYGDLTAWCLMPNHFHWQFYVKKLMLTRELLRVNVDRVEYQRRLVKYGKKAQAVERAWTRNADPNELITLNDAIGILQRSYTQALNRQLPKRSGSLWREACKAKDGWIDEFVTLEKHGKTDFRFQHGNDYAYQCFYYIHENPRVAGLVKHNIDYPWSSARDSAGLRKGTLCNLEGGRNLRDYL